MIQPYLDMVPVIDPEAWVHPAATIMGDVVLAAGASIWPGSVLRGDQGGIRIGVDTNIQDLTTAHATGGLSTVVIGDRVTVGHRAILHGCKVGNDCLVGMGSILLDNCEIGDWSVVGAGALVPVGMKVPPRTLVLGSPARVVRTITDKDIERIQIGVRTYRELAARYRAQGIG